jgi:hypothetical protein
VCVYLLGLLKTHKGEHFRTTGGHSTITPCTLPEWLPANITNKMIEEFGVRLRRELVKLQNLGKVLRHHNRTSSNDTRRISIDSVSSGLESVDHGVQSQRVKEIVAEKGKERNEEGKVRQSRLKH